MNQHLTYHPSSAYQPRVSDKTLLHHLAKSALKNIPGSADVIQEHFGTTFLKRELSVPKIQNQVRHMGYDSR